MLAYILWHWPDPSTEQRIYIEKLISFHETLAAVKPRGFHHSTVYVVNGATWLENADGVFEEWYLLENSAAMDVLNEAAVTGVCEQPHNSVARAAAGGTGGLYRLESGESELRSKRIAYRFSKPTGVSYSEFIDSIEKVSGPGTALWLRQMTLGPGPEFCLLASNKNELPHQIEPLDVPLQLVWSGE